MNYTTQSKLRIKSHEGSGRPKRKRISSHQLEVLTNIFEQIKTPNHQLREHTAKELNMTNREVQVWFQNRRAKLNRKKAQEKDHFLHWPCNKEHDNKMTLPLYQSSSASSQSSVTSSTSSTLYSQVSPQMRPIDILALAAEYVQRCDEEKRLTECAQRLEEERTTNERRKSWRPWD
ncbi:unnamed protein product [Rhizopus stolonifer]